MHKNTRSAPHTRLATLTLALVALTGCHAADVEAIEEHMHGACNVVPRGPACAFAPGKDAAGRVAFERYAATSVTRAETEQCILDVDCSADRMADDADAAYDEMFACMHADPAAVDAQARRDGLDADCVDICEVEVSQCGDAECAPATVTQCLDDYDGCLAACPALGASTG